MNKPRPKHLALHLIKLPLPGIVSILHRISGLLLFVALAAVVVDVAIQPALHRDLIASWQEALRIRWRSW